MHLGAHPPSKGSRVNYPNPSYAPAYTYKVTSYKVPSYEVPSYKVPSRAPEEASKPQLAATQVVISNGQGNYFFAEFAYYILRLFMPQRNTYSTGSLHQFCHSLIRTSCPPIATILPALAYLERVRADNPKWLAQQPQDQLFLASLILASKYVDDAPLPNAHWAALTSFAPRQLNSLELRLFDISAHVINFGPHLFDAWCKRLDQFIIFKSNQQPLYYFPTSPTLAVTHGPYHQAQCCYSTCCSAVGPQLSYSYYAVPAYPGSIAYPTNVPTYPGLGPTKLATPFGSAAPKIPACHNRLNKPVSMARTPSAFYPGITIRLVDLSAPSSRCAISRTLGKTSVRLARHQNRICEAGL
ncbi:hypothetical protein L0F63_005841 [Massospora cicadina]|nr:hypothetical protein L0F63_005841 [Massospora cicadina]